VKRESVFVNFESFKKNVFFSSRIAIESFSLLLHNLYLALRCSLASLLPQPPAAAPADGSQQCIHPSRREKRKARTQAALRFLFSLESKEELSNASCFFVVGLLIERQPPPRLPRFLRPAPSPRPPLFRLRVIDIGVDIGRGSGRQIERREGRSSSRREGEAFAVAVDIIDEKAGDARSGPQPRW
jgi:hypothetical protein